MAPPLVPYAWDATNMSTQNAQQPNSGTEEKFVYRETSEGVWSSLTASHSASATKPWQDAQTHPTQLGTSAWDVGSQVMAPSSVLRHRRSNPLTPYKPDAWCRQLDRHRLLEKYPDLYHSLTNGFDVGIPSILQMYTPPNNPSISKYPEAYKEIMEKEFQKKRYIGPFSRSNLEILIGPFQSSPLSLVPKPRKPGKFHAVHDFSHPHTPCTNPVLSINSAIDSHNFPCTWGRFSMVCLIIYQLPPGSQLPYELYQKLIGPFLSITINGQVWSYGSKVMTASQQIQTITLGSPQLAELMASSQTQVQIFSG